MSDHAGFLCVVADIRPAHVAAQKLRRDIIERGFYCPRPSQIIDVYRWRHLAMVSEAVLAALVHYVEHGGGSRGARAYLASDGSQVPDTQHGALDDYRFREERAVDREHKLVLRWHGDGFSIEQRALRTMEDPGKIFFEKNWSNFLTGSIYRNSFKHQ